MTYQHVVYPFTPSGQRVSGGPVSRGFTGSQQPIRVRSQRVDVDDAADDEIGEGSSGVEECPLSDIDTDDDSE